MSRGAVVGLRQNLLQFSLLVLINLFVGSMVGLERTVLPLLGEEVFGLVSASATLSFIASFGFTKAFVNLAAGTLADRFGRKRILVFGWAVGVFVPVIVIAATAWWQIVLANVLLGVNQGLAWSMTVNMKMDLADARQRGLALAGVGEFAGYTGLALASGLSGLVAAEYFLRPEPFYLGVVFALVGLALSVTVKGTEEHLARQVSQGAGLSEERLSRREIFWRTSLTDPTLCSCSVSGLITNLKDGMAWGLFRCTSPPLDWPWAA